MNLAKLARVAKQTLKRTIYSSLALWVGVSSLAVLAPLFVNSGTAYAAGNTLYVATTGTDSGTCQVSATPCQTISYAISHASSGDTISVGAGTYNGNLTINTPVNLIGGGESSSFITGQTTINVSGVSVSGFNITNPGGEFGILINHVGLATVTGNNIHDVNGTTYNDYGVYFQSGGSSDVSGITVSNNTISDIGSSTTAKTSGGIGIGDSSSHINVSGLTINGNIISNVNSSTKGAYGVLLNLGASSSLAADTASVSNASIENNTISALTGGWEHAIGLETNTPSAAITGNTISGLTTGSDVEAVHFEKNPSASTVTLTGTTFNGHGLSNSTSSVLVDPSVPTVSSSSELNTYPEFLNGDVYNYGGLNAFTTIQNGATGVASGGTVNVHAGTYPNVNLSGTYNSSITVDGGSAATTTINGLDLSGATFDGLTFKNLTFTGGSGATNAASVNLDSAGSYNNLTFSNDTFDGGSQASRLAMFINQGFDGFTLQNNTFQNYDGSSYGTVYSVVFAEAQGSDWGQNFTATGNSLTNSTAKNFLEAYRWKDVSFTQNTVNAEGGRLLVWSDTQRGPLESLGTVTISDNNLTIQQGVGIELYNTLDTAANLVGNTISGGSACVDLDSVSNSSVTGNNTFSGCSTGLSFNQSEATSPLSATVSGNIFTGNTTDINNSTSLQIDGSLNYWGVNSSSAVAAKITGSVSYSPWFTSSALTTRSDAKVAPDSNGNATVNDTTPKVVVSSSTQSLNITVSNGTTGANIDYSSLQSGNTAIIPQTTVNTQNATISIPASTTVTATGGTWDGTITAPTVQANTSVSVPTSTGTITTVSTVIDVGSSSVELTFSKAVKLTIPGQAGKSVGFIRNGKFTQITTVCSANSQAVGDALPAGGDCYINVSNDMIVWTKHFTEFVTYTTSNKYVVKSGDTFSGIAAKVGLTLAQLEALNPKAGHPAGNFSLIYPGDVLSLGGASPAITTASAVTTASGTPPKAKVLGSKTSQGVIGTAASTTAAATVAKHNGLLWYEWLAIAVVVVGALGTALYANRAATHH